MLGGSPFAIVKSLELEDLRGTSQRASSIILSLSDPLLHPPSLSPTLPSILSAIATAAASIDQSFVPSRRLVRNNDLCTPPPPCRSANSECIRSTASLTDLGSAPPPNDDPARRGMRGTCATANTSPPSSRGTYTKVDSPRWTTSASSTASISSEFDVPSTSSSSSRKHLGPSDRGRERSARQRSAKRTASSVACRGKTTCSTSPDEYDDDGGRRRGCWYAATADDGGSDRSW